MRILYFDDFNVRLEEGKVYIVCSRIQIKKLLLWTAARKKKLSLHNVMVSYSPFNIPLLIHILLWKPSQVHWVSFKLSHSDVVYSRHIINGIQNTNI